MDTYALFLDEILPIQPFQYFCLAGVAVKETDYNSKVIPEINKVKTRHFGNTSVILHEFEINRAERGTPYEVLRDREKRQIFWNEISNMFKQTDIKVFGTAIHKEKLKSLYSNSRDIYFVSLQVVLENFVHFLEQVDGIGNVFIESRNSVQDLQLQAHFHTLKATGTLFYEPLVLQTRLGTISFPLKGENVIGLQIADVIPNPLNRDLCGMKQKTFDLIEVIKQNFYDGFIDRQDRFGIKIIP